MINAFPHTLGRLRAFEIVLLSDFNFRFALGSGR